MRSILFGIEKIEKLWSLWLDKRRHARCVSFFQMLRASVIKIINYQNPVFADSKRGVETILAAELQKNFSIFGACDCSNWPCFFNEVSLFLFFFQLFLSFVFRIDDIYLFLMIFYQEYCASHNQDDQCQCDYCLDFFFCESLF